MDEISCYLPKRSPFLNKDALGFASEGICFELCFKYS
jgi:hypothetical protein